jgi:hypothetical protein
VFGIDLLYQFVCIAPLNAAGTNCVSDFILKVLVAPSRQAMPRQYILWDGAHRLNRTVEHLRHSLHTEHWQIDPFACCPSEPPPSGTLGLKY